MAILVEATAPVADRFHSATPAPATQRQLAPAAPPLSRGRGGTYSPTVDVVRFADGTTAHTDLIRLNPNIDAYSLDFTGTSPRQLSHYREAGSWQAHVPNAALWREEITRILANSYPFVSTAELTRRLANAGYRGAGAIRKHEAIAATQAAIWRLTNGLELDTSALDAPVRALARIGDHPSARPVVETAAGLDWVSVLPAGEAVHLELELAGRPQLAAFGFTPGARTGRHQVRVHLERSHDGLDWYPVSHSGVEVPTSRGRGIVRRLGHGATLSSSKASAGSRGHRFYRLTATGPTDRDGLLELRDVRVQLTDSPRFRNSERIVHLYQSLLALVDGGLPAPSDVHARLLIGAKTAGGPGVFTPVVSLAPSASAAFSLAR
ncbi:MAG: thioester domain-containing protein [Propionicimonas sp.]